MEKHIINLSRNNSRDHVPRSTILTTVLVGLLVIVATYAYSQYKDLNGYRASNDYLSNRLSLLENEQTDLTSRQPQLDQAIPFDNDGVNMENSIAFNVDEVLDVAPSIILRGQTSSESTGQTGSESQSQSEKELGKAALAIFQGRTLYKIAAVNLADLKEGENYYAWLVNPDANEAISLGKMNFEASTSQAELMSVYQNVDSKFRGIVVTRGFEENVSTFSDPILSGIYEDNVDLEIDNNDLQNGMDTNATTSSDVEARIDRLNDKTAQEKSATIKDEMFFGDDNLDNQMLLGLLSGESGGMGSEGGAGMNFEELLKMTGTESGTDVNSALLNSLLD